MGTSVAIIIIAVWAAAVGATLAMTRAAADGDRRRGEALAIKEWTARARHTRKFLGETDAMEEGHTRD